MRIYPLNRTIGAVAVIEKLVVFRRIFHRIASEEATNTGEAVGTINEAPYNVLFAAFSYDSSQVYLCCSLSRDISWHTCDINTHRVVENWEVPGGLGKTFPHHNS